MRFFVKEEAYMTVEATVVFPVLLVSFLAMVYMVIFRYDRALVFQDSCMIAVYAKEFYLEDKDTFTEKTDGKIALFFDEHPYISLKNKNISYEKEDSELKIKFSSEFTTPFKGGIYSIFNIRDTVTEADVSVSVTDPVTVMRLTYDLMEDK